MQKLKDMNRDSLNSDKKRMFNVDQKMYKDLNRCGNSASDVINDEERRRFWAIIWRVEKEHKREAGWLRDLENEGNGEHLQEMVRISVEDVKE